METYRNVITDKMTAQFVLSQPTEISEVLGCNLPASELADFVMYKTNLFNLKKQLSPDGL